MKKIIAVDLFCGAGGTSSGLARACAKLGYDLDLVAVNHWDIAIATHSKNHPKARHICASIKNVNPKEAVPGGRVHLLVASPECVYFSNARGNKPINDQKRATPWDICNWLEKLYVENFIIENVKEFERWGPLGANGRPMKSKRGEIFQMFLNTIRALGYNVDYRILNAADYGDPTTRERLFIIGKRGNRRITWPVATHTKTVTDGNIFGADGRKKWVSAREIIDWSIPGKSIFTRKKPLAPATLRRIIHGVQKYGGPNAEAFLIVLRKHIESMSIDIPLSTITGSGSHHALVEVKPFIVPQGTWNPARDIERPLDTLTTTSRGVGLCVPNLIQLNGQSNSQSIDEPVPALTTMNKTAVVTSFMVPFKSENGEQTPRTHSVEEPMPTVASGGNNALVEGFIISTDQTGSGGQSVRSQEEPLSTIVTKQRHAVLEPLIVRACHGEKDLGAWPVGDPLRTITGKEQFALVEFNGNMYYVDILFRMLQKHELSAAMSFPRDYEFTGTVENVVKQIGNAVPGELSEALCTEPLKEYLGKAA